MVIRATQQKADPGVGREDAEVGTRPWAESMRLHMQGLVNNMGDRPESFARYVVFVQKHRAWTLMNRPDGSFFASFDEFCEHRQPWGLGQPWAKLRPFVDAASGIAAAPALPEELAATLAELGDDEIRTLVVLARRLLEGQRTYGKLDVANDQRDFRRERSEEIQDLLIYSAFIELQREART